MDVGDNHHVKLTASDFALAYVVSHHMPFKHLSVHLVKLVLRSKKGVRPVKD